MTPILVMALLAAPGFAIEYESYVPPRYECFVFLGTECPLARLSAERLNNLADRFPQVHFQGVCANEHDADSKVADFRSRLRFGFRKSPGTAERLGATRSPEAFLLVNGEVVYQGRIDDQYTPGTNRSRPTRRDLEEAIGEVLSGKPVSVPRTEGTGCHLPVSKPQESQVTFEQVAPILHAKCSGCHRPCEVAPFSLLTYNDTLGWADMIREVVSENRMPPWHAEGGHWANDRSLSREEKSLLLRWADAGGPPGRREPEAPAFTRGWSIRADVILEMEEEFDVPAEGIVENQEFVLHPGFQRDTWVQAIEFDPGCRAVVHHINIFLRPPGAGHGSIYYNDLFENWFGIMVPGTTETKWAAGQAKVVPAGWDMVLNVHYQPNGTPQKDRTRLALELAEASTVRQRIATRAIAKEDFVIPPHSVSTFTNDWIVEEDYTLFALMAHLHYRGRSMKIEADGKLLLNVPRYDLNWQHRYVLAHPQPLKRGTHVVITAVFDNTRNNPNNPNPDVTVVHGQRSTDEMMQACFDITRTHEDRLAEKARKQALFAGQAAILCVLLSALVFSRRWR